MAISVQAEMAKTPDAAALGASTNLEREIEAYSSVASEFQALADENVGAVATPWIRAAAANSHMSQGMRQLYTDRGEARQSFERAKGIYEDLIADKQEDVELADRVLYGYAQACEGLSFVEPAAERHVKNLEDAQNTYRNLSENAKSVGVKRLAEYRLRVLAPIAGEEWTAGDDAVDRRDWASWLAQQELPDPPLPQGGGGLRHPGGALPNPGGGPVLNPSLLPLPGGTGDEPKTEGDVDEAPQGDGGTKEKPGVETSEKEQAKPTAANDKADENPKGDEKAKLDPGKTPEKESGAEKPEVDKKK